MGKLLELSPTKAATDKDLRKAWTRLDRHIGLIFQVQEALKQCRKACPPSRRRELVRILRYFATKFPLDERALRCALTCLQIKLEQYEAAA